MRVVGLRCGAAMLAVALGLAAGIALVGPSPASAQTPDTTAGSDEPEILPSPAPQSASGGSLADPESSRRVDMVTRLLVGIAAVMAGLLAAFVWHTSPSRRLRVARRHSKRLFTAAAESEGPHAAEPVPQGGASGLQRRRARAASAG